MDTLRNIHLTFQTILLSTRMLVHNSKLHLSFNMSLTKISLIRVIHITKHIYKLLLWDGHSLLCQKDIQNEIIDYYFVRKELK